MSFSLHSFPRRQAQGAKRAFTLVELLVVCCIFAVVMAISLPAFTALAKGGGITVASRTMASKINGARSYALSHRCLVALIFPTDANSDPSVPDSLRYVAYRPAIVYATDSSGSSYAFSRWIDGEPWTFMPKGTFFGGPVFDISMGGGGMPNVIKAIPVAGCDFTDLAGTASSSTVKNCLIFTPYGALATDDSTPLPFAIGLWEGGMANSKTPQPTNKSNSVKIVVNQFTGRPSCVGR